MTDKLGTGEKNTLQLFPARPEPIYVPIILAIPIYSNFSLYQKTLFPAPHTPGLSSLWRLIASHGVSWCLITPYGVSWCPNHNVP